MAFTNVTKVPGTNFMSTVLSEQSILPLSLCFRLSPHGSQRWTIFRQAWYFLLHDKTMSLIEGDIPWIRRFQICWYTLSIALLARLRNDTPAKSLSPCVLMRADNPEIDVWGLGMVFRDDVCGLEELGGVEPITPEQGEEKTEHGTLFDVGVVMEPNGNGVLVGGVVDDGVLGQGKLEHGVKDGFETDGRV